MNKNKMPIGVIKMKNSNKYIFFWLSTFLILFSALTFLSQNNYFTDDNIVMTNNHLSINFLDKYGSFELERTDGGYFSFIDKNTEKEIDRTAREVFIGDRLILGDNSLYEVESIEGDKVYCTFKGKEEITWSLEKAVFSTSSDLLAKKSKDRKSVV